MFHLVRPNFSRLHKSSSTARLVANANCYCSDSKDDDGQKKPKQPSKEDGKKPASSTSLSRLNELLSMMNTGNEVQLVKKVQLAQPAGQKKGSGSKKAKKGGSDSESDSDDERPKDLLKATKKVASSLGGDAKQTEAELLAKLLGGSAEGSSLSDIITGMQVDREGGAAKEEIKLTRSSVVRKSIEKKGSKDQRGDYAREPRERKRAPLTAVVPPPTGASVKLFDGEPLGIFTDPALLRESPDVLKTWSALNERELRLAVTHPPANYFQKMALWTEQGKLWRFPIDNEQGLDAEAKVSFTEHIFLEDHLEPWCPKRGPIRHFMELVCVGLSKNYFISAQEKREHILWFREYFEQKKDLLKQVIVQEETGSAAAGSAKQVEK
uniref:Small ribosomal subunit protein mS31 n=1 Tax=Culex tarsalis TaxID=7177 RepID=A0A1Q3F7T8_CULTA